MGMNPRSHRRRSTAQRSWSGPRPSTPFEPRPNRRRRPPATPTATDPAEATATFATLDTLLDEFTESWSRGERPRAEGYLARLPGEAQAELIYHEYCLAEADHLDPDPQAYLRRFPEQSTALERLFALHGAVSASSLRQWVEPSDLPDTGDEIGPYLLVRELGKGSFARVFLAEQSDLGDRLVVVKISTRASAEPQLLGKARHAHIVEVLRQADANDGAFHLVCMPFLGGATLASILDERRRVGRRPRTGRHLLADLDRVSAPEYPQAELARPAREVVDKLSYAQAMAWIVARLAEALEHAHSKGVTHGDLKPTNILITAEGTPMLFDFNLAVDWHEAEADGLTTDAGGTLVYMAPERLNAVANRFTQNPTKAPDRHRADLFALGLVLLEALSGRAPSVPRGGLGGGREFAANLAESRRGLVRSLQGRKHRSIPLALRSILAKCLSYDPLDRYGSGKELAEDLDRWRLDRSLIFAEEPRRSDLVRRLRSSRLALAAGVLTLVSAVAVGLVGSFLMEGTKREQSQNKLSTLLDRSDAGVFLSRKFGRWRSFDDLIDPAVLATQHLARYGVETDPDWRSRDAVRALPDVEREELEAWLFEQVWRLSVALRARSDSPGDWRRALSLLDRTIAQVPLSTLRSERLAVRARLKLEPIATEAAAASRPPRWLEDYLAGVAAEPLYAREALNHYQEVLRSRPDMFWAHYRSAALRCRIDEYPEAVDHLRRCVARRPNNPLLHTFLAALLYKSEGDTLAEKRGQAFSAALNECDRALELDPDFAEANSIKARILQASGQTDSVRSQIDRFAMLTRLHSRSSVSLLRMNTNLYDGPNYDEDSSAAVVALSRQVLAENPDDHETRAILASELGRQDQGFEAVEAYDRVLDADPGHLRARFDRASLIHRRDPQAAMAEYADMINHPRFEEVFREQPMAIRAFHHVATRLLKQGKVAEALEVAHRSLAHVNRSRSFQDETIEARALASKPLGMSAKGETYYLLARIHAVAARSDQDQVGQAIAYLDRAFRIHPNFQDNWFANDPLFDNIRPEVLKRIEARVVKH